MIDLLLRLLDPATWRKRNAARCREIAETTKYCPACGKPLTRIECEFRYESETGKLLGKCIQIICGNYECDNDACNPLIEWEEDCT